MARRKWSLRVGDDPSDFRQKRVRRDLIRLGIAAVLLVVGFLGSAAATLFRAAQESIAERGLALQSVHLQTEVDGLRTLIDTLGSSIARLSRRTEPFRLNAGGRSAEAGIRKAVGALPVSADPSARIRPLDATPTRVNATLADMDELLQRARLLVFSWREAGDELKRKYDDLASTPSILPTSGYIASVFSWSRWHPILGRPRPHLGVDIVAPAGTPVVAAARGRVAFVGRRGEYGNLIDIDHGNGRVTRYAHLSRTEVRVGQWVERGASIGKVGSTGLAAGPHLHYEVLINGRPANPRTFIVEGGTVTN